jgi:hypothetical protein
MVPCSAAAQRLLFAAGFAASFLLMAAGCRKQEVSVSKKSVGMAVGVATSPQGDDGKLHFEPPSWDGYVGSHACQECHRELCDSYASHPMGQSIRPIDLELESKRLADIDRLSGEETSNAAPEGALIAGREREYWVDVQEGRLVHHERMRTSDGSLLYETSVPMDYVVGSGARAMAYLHARDSLLFMSPLNWYSDVAKWDFAPGHSAEDRRRFDRRVNDDCLSCHAGRVNVLARGENRYRQPHFHELSVGCENCHGAGEKHIQYQQQSSAVVSPENDPIVNPAKLDHQRREAICYQCHLHAPGRILRPGRTHFDFRPGMRLDDVWAMMVTDTGVGADSRTEAVSQVQQMHASRCYIASEGKLGCTSCHDPHHKPLEAERSAHYRASCLQCHNDDSCEAPQEQRSEQGDSCVDCHMPALDTKRISHVSQTDHRILREPRASIDKGGVEGTGLSTSRDKLTFLWDTAKRLSGTEQQRALGMTLWLEGGSQGRRPPPKIADILKPIVGQSEENATGEIDGPVLSVLGAFSLEYQQLPRAREYFERALEDPMVRENALSNLLTIHYLSAEWEQVLQCSQQLLEIDSKNARVLSLRADALANLSDFEQAASAAEKALQLDPTLQPVRQWLMQLYERNSNEEDARRHREFLEKLQ